MATCHVFVLETTVIPCYHEVRLQVQLEDENTNGDYVGLFKIKKEMYSHHGLLFGCSVSPVHNGKAVFQLVNPIFCSCYLTQSGEGWSNVSIGRTGWR